MVNGSARAGPAGLPVRFAICQRMGECVAARAALEQPAVAQAVMVRLGMQDRLRFARVLRDERFQVAIGPEAQEARLVLAFRALVHPTRWPRDRHEHVLRARRIDAFLRDHARAIGRRTALRFVARLESFLCAQRLTRLQVAPLLAGSLRSCVVKRSVDASPRGDAAGWRVCCVPRLQQRAYRYDRCTIYFRDELLFDFDFVVAQLAWGPD